MPLQPKKWLAGLKSCPHGGIDYAELKSLGVNPDDILDFSASTNPFMPPPGTREKMKDAPIERYPDSQAAELRQRLSERLGIFPNSILIGSGTTEIIRLIALTYFRRNDPVLIIEPTYGEYEIAGLIAGARLLKYRAPEDSGFTPHLHLDEVIASIRRHRLRAVFICNPNNPTGKYLPREDIEKIAGALNDSLLILDEAYIAFVEKSWSPFDLTEKGNVVVLRSMTKDYGLPGLRLGYAVARREIIASLRKVLPPWNINAVAQHSGLAVLEEEAYLRQSLRKINEAKYLLTAGLTRLGFRVLPSDTHFFLVKVGNATACRHELLKRCILVRDCSSFGLPEYIRVSPHTPPECEKFIESMNKIIGEAQS